MGKNNRLEEKRSRILEAARYLILRDGLRGMTMEAIARQARIAKPTLYAYFPDKIAVTNTLIDDFLEEILTAAEMGFEVDGAVADKIAEALAQQYLAMADILRGSPHADELINEPRHYGFTFKERHFRMEAKITNTLHAAGAGDAEALMKVITASAYGIFLKISDPDAMGKAIKLACRRIIAPELS